ncbi:MAG: hypothetical protein MH472_10565 [Bacteroidia bacterium]|nr:hypothetical protein [Bacteroidia bacterium]
MAHPVFTIIHPNNHRRYFQEWDTFTGYPSTVPMDLITFLQYKGLYNKEYIGTIFFVYHQLIKNGTTLNGWIFPETNKLYDPFYLQATLYINTFDTPLDLDKIAINNQLEDLFSLNIDFSDFYERYLNLVSSINLHPPMPINYYRSLAYTAECLDKSGAKVNDLAQQVFKQYNLSPLFERERKTFDFDVWFKTGLFFSYQEVMADLFVQLALHNLLAIDAIPHVLRKNDTVISLFRKIGLENLLYEEGVAFVNAPVKYRISQFDATPYLRAYVNYAAFHFLGSEELIGLPIFDTPINELESKLGELYIVPYKFVNFVDNNDKPVLPMIYSSYFSINNDYLLHALAPFTRQQYHIYTDEGTLVDTNGYYNFYAINKSVLYVQEMDLVTWQRIAYDDTSKSISYSDVSVVLDYTTNDECEIFNNLEKTFATEPIRDDQQELNKKYNKQELVERENTSQNNDTKEDDLPF